nr:glycoside hydrolase family 18 protein [Clostridium beijerinckii]
MEIKRIISSYYSSNTAKYRIVGYIHGATTNVNPNKLTHINYAFGSIINSSIFIPDYQNLMNLVSLKSQNPKLMVILSIGGWGAEGFSDAAYLESSRSSFANSCLDIVNKYGIDGIDIDWEYPVSGSCNLIKCTPKDKENFTLLLKSIRNKIGTNKILSIAAGADKFYINNVEINGIVNICDYINLMTYDFGYNTHNANLYPTSSPYGSGFSCDESVNIFLQAGVPAMKINLGIPFYGYHGHEYLSYGNLLENYINKNGWTRYWDYEAKAAYLKNDDSFITYEDEESIDYKIKYIKSKGLGGAMFWEYNQDYNDILLNKLWTGLNE